MTPPETRPDNLDQIASLLDQALRDVLSDVADPQLVARVLRFRRCGLGFLVLASICIVAVALLSPSVKAVGALLLGCTAIILLSAGGWLIDRAAKDELRAHKIAFSGVLREILLDADEGLVRAKIRRRHFLGINMLVLSGFCMCIATVPLPGKQLVDGLMWSGFSITLIVIGCWQLRKSAKDAARTNEMSAAALRREAAKSGTHIGRVS